MKSTTESLERAHGRIEQLYEISRLFTDFQDIERTVPRVLDVARGALPLRSACLIDEGRHGARMTTWHTSALSETRLRAGADHARAAYAYLAGAEHARALTDAVAQDRASEFQGVSVGASDGPSRFVALPLVALGQVLGVIQLEGVGAWDESDLAFMNAIARELAVVLQRSRADQTRRDEAEAEAVRYLAALEAVRRHEHTVSTVSHDLKTPVFTILLSTQLMLKNDAPPPWAETRKFVEGIQRAARRMDGMIHDLLDFGSLEAGQLTVEKQPHALGALVHEAVEQHQLMALHRAQRLRAEVSTEAVTVRCDHDRLMRVFSNLLSNAIKYTPHGGEITVRGEVRGRDAWFAVCDDGPGIAPQHLPHLFDRYWKETPNDRGSSGLGLAIAKGIALAHGGQIQVESRVGVGTTFSFSVPLSDVH